MSHRSLTIGLVLTVSMGALESLAVATIMPVIVADIGGLELYGWVFSAFMLSNLVGTSVAGRLADQRGAAPPFVMGTLLFIGGLLIAGVAPFMPVMVLGRAAQGFGAGAISSTSYLAVARAYVPEERPRIMALLSSAWVVPGLIGPALAGAVTDYVGWRWVFLGLAPCTALSSIVAVPSLRRIKPHAEGVDDSARIVPALQLAAGTGLALFGLESGPMLATMALTAAGIAVAIPALRGLVPAGTLRAAPGQPAAIATLALLNAAFFGSETFLPLSLTSIRGQSSTITGIALTAATLTWTSGAWLQARLATKVARRVLNLTGLVLTLAGIAGTASILNDAVPVMTTAVTWGVAGLGMGIAYSTLTLAALEGATAGNEGAVSAAVQLATMLGTALGAGVGGAIVALNTADGAPARLGLEMVSALTIAFGVLACVLGRRT